MINFYSEVEQSKIDELKADGVIVDWLSGLCPVQSNGWIDGRAYYFKARGDQWHMSITRTESHNVDDALDYDDGKCWTHLEPYGKVPDAGYMPFIEALQFIEWCARQIRIGR